MNTIQIERNQAQRTAYILAEINHYTYVGYQMLNGATYFNAFVFSDTYDYKAVSLKKMLELCADPKNNELRNNLFDFCHIVIRYIEEMMQSETFLKKNKVQHNTKVQLQILTDFYNKEHGDLFKNN